MKKTTDDIIAAIAKTNRSNLLDEGSPYVEVVQQFIEDNLNEPNVLLELLEFFIADKLLPMDKKQYNVLLSVAFENNKIDLLRQVPHGVSRMLIDAVKNNLNFGTILMDYIGKGGKVSIDITDEQGKTALHYALEQKNVSKTLIVYLLDCAEGVMKFKPLIEAFLAVPATEQNKEAWDYLSNRFKTEYASTEEEGECSSVSASEAFLAVPATEQNKEDWDCLSNLFQIEHASTEEKSEYSAEPAFEAPQAAPAPLARNSFFYAGESLDDDDCVQAPKRLKL